jgi:hypothetical protein
LSSAFKDLVGFNEAGVHGPHRRLA